jgi:hypothetical protein
MSGQDQVTSAGTVRQAAQSYYAEDVATTASYADVSFTDDHGRTQTVLSTGHAISALIRAEADTQDCNIKVLARPANDYPWRELVAETALVDGTDTEVLADTVRDWQIKVQVKEGGTSGGTVSVGVCLK